MQKGLQRQKQAVVRDALYDAAIDLFAENGFDETTVEEVAQAAGVSRRTLFRYFDSKDDLLAYAVLNYTRALAEAVKSCPTHFSPLQVVTETVLASARFSEAAKSRTRQVIKISERSASARQAYQSRMMDVQDNLARALATHFHDDSPYDLRPMLLAAVTLTAMNATIISWFRGQHGDIVTAAEEVLKELRTTFSDSQRATRSKSYSPSIAKHKRTTNAATIARLRTKSR